ncbi:MAG: hypothetical protein ACLPUT_08805 [Solirubrobacteraceae bacterium]
MGTATSLALLILAVSVWTAIGVLRSVRDRLGSRFAEWLIPDGQAITFRIAWCIVWIAERIAPNQEITHIDIPAIPSRLPLPHLWRGRLAWDGPRKAAAELRNASKCNEFVDAPVRRALQLTSVAASHRRRNARRRAELAFVWPLCLTVDVVFLAWSCAVLAPVGEIMTLFDRMGDRSLSPKT